MKSSIWSVSSVNVTFAGSTGLVHATDKSREPQPPRAISPARNVAYRRIKVNFRLIKVKFSSELYGNLIGLFSFNAYVGCTWLIGIYQMLLTVPQHWHTCFGFVIR